LQEIKIFNYYRYTIVATHLFPYTYSK